MDSWIYIFSKFTSEALFFESILILLLCASYVAFWVVRKRRLGSLDESVPSGVVKVYLNELISEARLVRTQLFGLLSDVGIQFTEVGSLGAGAAGAGVKASDLLTNMQVVPSGDASLSQAAEKIAADPALAGRMGELQQKLDQQNKAMEALMAEKEKIKAELSNAKSGGGGGGGDATEVNALREKVKGLEGRLSEYSIIEDDLANLKRLQQENAQLKAALDGKGEAPAADTDAGADSPESEAPAAEETSGADEPAEEQAAAEENTDEAKADEGTSEEEAAAAAEEAPAEEKAEAKEESTEAQASDEASSDDSGSTEEKDANFDGLVDQVEDSLKAEEEKPAEEKPEEGKEASAEGSEPEAEKKEAEAEKKKDAPPAEAAAADDDLLSEFEKMLNM